MRTLLARAVLRVVIAVGVMAAALPLTPGVAEAADDRITLNLVGGETAGTGIRVKYQSGQFQVMRDGANQLFKPDVQNPPSTTLFNGIAMSLTTSPTTATGRTVYPTGFNLASANSGTSMVEDTFDTYDTYLIDPATGSRISGTSTTGSGSFVSEMSFTDPGSNLVYKVTLRVDYVYPDEWMKQTFTVSIPAGNTRTIRLFNVYDTYLGSSDTGPGYYQSASTSAVEMVFTQKTGVFEGLARLSGPQWAGYASENYKNVVFSQSQVGTTRYGPGFGANLTKRIDPTTTTDNGIGINWDFGTNGTTGSTAAPASAVTTQPAVGLFTFALPPAPPTITTASVGPAAPNAPFTQSLAGSVNYGTLADATWALAPGSSLPLGLTLAADGTLSGTPTTPGSYTYTVTLTDALGTQATKTYTTVVSPTITYDANGATGTIAAQSGAAGSTVTLDSGSSLTPTGASNFLGWSTDPNATTPTYTGGQQITMPASGLKLYAVWDPPLVAAFTYNGNGALGSTSPTSGTIGSNVTVAANGFTTPAGASFLGWSTNPNASTPDPAYDPGDVVAMPAGGTTLYAVWSPAVSVITYSANGGTGSIPNAPAANGSSVTVSSSLGLTPPGGKVFLGWSTDPNAVSPDPAYDPGDTVTMPAGGVNLHAVWGTVTPSITTTSLIEGTTGSAYSQTVMATGGTGALTFSLDSGTLPAGLSLNPTTGEITGTPTTPGSSTFTVKVRDANGQTATKQLTIDVAAPVDIATTSLPSGTTGSAYAQAVAVTGGTGSYTFALASGTLPAGLSLNTATGEITGTPTTAGTSSFSVTATDGAGRTDTQALSITVNPVGSSSITYAPNGGSGSVSPTTAVDGSSVTLASGAGLTAPSAGRMFLGWDTDPAAATPAYAAGQQVTMPAGGLALHAIWSAAPAGPTITTASLPDGTTGAGYSQTIAASGGTGTLTFSLDSGTLPAGLSLASTGAITGTPSTVGSSTFTVKVTDANSQTATHVYTVTITSPGGPSITTTSLPGALAGAPYAQTVAATGGTGPYSFAVTSGALPAGLSMASNGAITGTPSTVGSSTFTVTVTDANNQIATRPLTIAVTNTAPAPAPSPAAPPTWTLTYDGNGGGPAPGPTSGVDGSWVNTPGAGAIARPGFVFTGWNTAADGSGLGFAPGAPTQLSGDNTLFAQWTPLVVQAVDAAATSTGAPVSGSAAGGSQVPTGSVFAKATDPAYGTAVMNADGSYTYTPAAGFTGTDAFTYTVCAPGGAPCSTATVRITVAGAPSAPVQTPTQVPVQDTLAAPGSTPPGAVFTLMTPPVHGVVDLAPTGDYTYAPNPGFTGTDAFTYQVCVPGSPVCPTGTVTISVTPDQGVRATPIVKQANATGTTPMTFIPSNSAAQATAITISPTGASAWTDRIVMAGKGTWVVRGTQVTFTPAPGFVGRATIRYRSVGINGTVSFSTFTAVRVAVPGVIDGGR